MLCLAHSLGRKELLHLLHRQQNGGTKQDHVFSKVSKGISDSPEHPTGAAPAPRLPSSAGALGSRRGQKCLVKPEGWDVTADTKKRHRWWTGLHTTAAACSWDLPSPAVPGMLSCSSEDGGSRSRPRINPCLFKSLYSAICSSNTLCHLERPELPSRKPRSCTSPRV